MEVNNGDDRGGTEQMEIKKRCAKAHRSHYEIFIYNC
jgi:hypothetical protein